MKPGQVRETGEGEEQLWKGCKQLINASDHST